jgi:hypothetical protein
LHQCDSPVTHCPEFCLDTYRATNPGLAQALKCGEPVAQFLSIMLKRVVGLRPD